MTAHTMPAGTRPIDLPRAAAVLTRLRRGDTMMLADLSAELGMERHVIARALKALVAAEMVIAETVVIGYTRDGPTGASCTYIAAARTDWPDWLPMPQEAPETARHGAICDAKHRGTVSSVWELGGAAA